VNEWFRVNWLIGEWVMVRLGYFERVGWWRWLTARNLQPAPSSQQPVTSNQKQAASSQSPATSHQQPEASSHPVRPESSGRARPNPPTGGGGPQLAP